MFHTSMNSKTTITFTTLTIAAVALVFVSSPILGNQQALATNIGNVGHLYDGGYPYFGGYPGYTGYGGHPYYPGYGGYPYYYHHHHQYYHNHY
ncbi:MAG: hypothetical protein WAM14_26430 [Candidatus Nitrosopolaris sp.]